MSNDDVNAAITKALEPYCKGYCNDPARLEVVVTNEFVNAHLFLSANDHAAISPGDIGNHLSDCFDMLGRHMGEGRERLDIDFVLKT